MTAERAGEKYICDLGTQLLKAVVQGEKGRPNKEPACMGEAVTTIVKVKRRLKS